MGYLARATERIHMGSGIFNLSPRVNHPVRNAERVAMLDHLTGGRFEFGTGRGAGSHEIGTFNIHDPNSTKAEWDEVAPELIKMWERKDYTFKGEHFAIDVPHNFVVSYIYALPAVSRYGFIGKQVLSGWQINGITTLRSGQPFNVTSGVDTNFDGTNNDRPNVVGNPFLPGGRGRVATKNQYFNTAAFVTPPAGTPYGNAQFDMLFGPKYINTDLSALKSFAIYRECNLQFRADIFNVFNNVNMNAPNGTKSSTASCVLLDTASPQQVAATATSRRPSPLKSTNTAFVGEFHNSSDTARPAFGVKVPSPSLV